MHELKSFFASRPFKKYLPYVLIFLAIAAGFATYGTFSRTEFWREDSKSFLILLNIDFVLLLTIVILLARRLTRLWMAQKMGQIGAKLHTKFVVIFGLLAMTPAVLISVFSGFLFNMGLQIWFNDRVKTALQESTKIAQAYLEEHQKVIRANVHTMARDLAQDFHIYVHNPQLLQEALDLHAETRNLDEALVFDGTPNVLARSRLSFSLEFEVFTPQALETAKTHVLIRTSEKGDRVRALLKIAPHIDAYLLVGRIVDPLVFRRIHEVADAVSNYHLLEDYHKKLEVYFILMFMVITLLLLLTAIWVALNFASRIVKPISDLIQASEQVRSGDLNVRVTESAQDDEIALLSRSFNRMTGQLDEQQQKLLQVNKTLDSRRQFIEDVLSGVSAGVIGLNAQKVVQIFNKSAADLLDWKKEKTLVPLATMFPEVMPLFEQFEAESAFVQGHIKVQRRRKIHILMVRIVQEKTKGVAQGYIVTFDDITELVSAQRKAAWADVARRIAHEIRNPLTPIQLSAERLQRKYTKQITENKEQFSDTVETIVRQVTHIGNMVKEFAHFAKMPEPKMQLENIVKLVSQSMRQEEVGNRDIKFTFTSKEKQIDFLCDSAQIGQLMTNLLQNAVDSIKEKTKKNTAKDYQGHIQVLLENSEKIFTIKIEDNGLGFPKDKKDVLTEPYVTHKEKGTGLGLAIVKKIVEDHEGTLALEDSLKGQKIAGAIVILTFPKTHERETAS